MLFELITIGALWTYGLFLIPLAILFVASSKDNGTAATVTVIITALVLTLFTNINVPRILLDNWATAILAVPAYMVLGALWSRFKWSLFLRATDAVYQRLRTDWFESVKLPLNSVLSQSQKDDLRVYVQRNNNSMYRNFPPQASREKARITSWIAYWPFSIVGFFIGDLICNFANFCYTYLATYYQRVANRHFAKYAELAD